FNGLGLTGSALAGDIHGRGHCVGDRGGEEPGEFCGDAGKFPARDVRRVYGGDGRAFVDVVGVHVGVRGLQLQSDHSGSAAERAAESDFDRFPSWTLHERHALRLGSAGKVAVTGDPDVLHCARIEGAGRETVRIHWHVCSLLTQLRSPVPGPRAHAGLNVMLRREFLAADDLTWSGEM